MSGERAALPRLLCIMGSGETAPTMVSVHADLLSRLGAPPVPAVLLDTPFGFQENADDICAKAMQYFAQNVGYPIEVASLRDVESVTPLEYETMLARVSSARYVFAGPGSPTYALRQWRPTPLRELLAAKLRDGGCVTFASAAACGLGAFSLPVYEVYKVGEPARWLQGLNLLAEMGLNVALIPHYNNAEGGTHDTRYCYMGERRLRILEEQLPDDVDVLGVDEHTACIFDLDEGTVTVRGRGVVTWRHRGASRVHPHGAVMQIAELASASSDGDASAQTSATLEVAHGAAPQQALGASNGATPFMEEVMRQSELAGSALQGADVEGVVTALLAIDTQMHEWAADTFTSDERDTARALQRRLMVQLGELAEEGAADPRERLAPVVDRVLTLRRELRSEGRYDVADRLRDLLVDAGVEVRDTRDGSDWDLAAAGRRA